MIAYSLYNGAVIVRLNSDDPNRSALIEYETAEGVTPAAIRRVKDKLQECYGAFGHLIGESTTPIDLDAAMLSPTMKKFNPQIIEGEELVDSYDPGIPDGAVT